MHRIKGTMRQRVCAHTVFLLSASFLAPQVASAAARLVVMAVNSGSDITAPYDFQPPQLTPGAKGFLIGFDTGEFPEPIAFGVQDLTIHGSGLVNVNGVDLSNGNLTQPPKIMTRTEAQLQSLDDGFNYRSEDTYVLDQPQLTSAGERFWFPVGTGLEGGSSDEGFVRVTSLFGFGPVPQGVYPLSYVVSTGDLSVSGFLAVGYEGFDPSGKPLGEGANIPGLTVELDFDSPSFQLTTAPTGAGTLVGCDRLGRLFNVSPTNGVLEYTRLTGVDRIAGIAFSDDGTLLGISTTAEHNISELYKIDVVTGTTTLIGGTGILDFAEGDLKTSPLDGQMYCVSKQGRIFTVDTSTGQCTLAGTIANVGEISAIAFAPNGFLYVLDSVTNSLLTINPENSSTVDSVSVMDVFGSGGMEYDPATGRLLVVTAAIISRDGTFTYERPAMYSIDPATGKAEFLGRSTSEFMSGLVFNPPFTVPEPSSLLLVGAAVVGMAVVAAKRRRAAV